MKKMVTRLIALGVVGFAIYRALRMAGVIGGDDSVDFEWVDDDTN
ncbi:MAG: hypothetical protein O3A10_08280 [Chloroflexi bacterium]|nr:hypothetical protein [Chloroflexota bacterium]MDA1146591.1 hypothetical protein [Chloroflexota bacterium]